VNTVKNLRVPYKGGAGGFLEQLWNYQLLKEDPAL
jgi:hypothetical protein